MSLDAPEFSSGLEEAINQLTLSIKQKDLPFLLSNGNQ